MSLIYYKDGELAADSQFRSYDSIALRTASESTKLVRLNDWAVIGRCGDELSKKSADLILAVFLIAIKENQVRIENGGTGTWKGKVSVSSCPTNLTNVIVMTRDTVIMTDTTTTKSDGGEVIFFEVTGVKEQQDNKRVVFLVGADLNIARSLIYATVGTEKEMNARQTIKKMMEYSGYVSGPVLSYKASGLEDVDVRKLLEETE